MKFIIMFTAVLSTLVQADPIEVTLWENSVEKPIECRQAIVEAHDSLRDPIDPDSFSSMSIEEFTLSPEEFNNLETGVQIYYYNALKPVSLMVEAVIDRLNSVISFYVDNEAFREVMKNYIIELRARRQALRSCY